MHAPRVQLAAIVSSLKQFYHPFLGWYSKFYPENDRIHESRVGRGKYRHRESVARLEQAKRTSAMRFLAGLEAQGLHQWRTPSKSTNGLHRLSQLSMKQSAYLSVGLWR